MANPIVIDVRVTGADRGGMSDPNNTRSAGNRNSGQAAGGQNKSQPVGGQSQAIAPAGRDWGKQTGVYDVIAAGRRNTADSAAGDQSAKETIKDLDIETMLAERRKSQPARAFDPKEEALKRIERETRKRSTEEAYRRLQGLPEDAQITTYKPGMRPPPVQAGAGAAAAAGEAGAAIAEGGEAAGAGAGAAGAAGAVGAAAAAIGAVAGPAAIAATALAGLAAATTKLMKEFIDRGHDLAGYSPQIAGAGAVASVRSLQADIREANSLGPGIAELTDAESRLETLFRDTVLPIKQGLIETLIPILETIVILIQPLSDFAKEHPQFIANTVKNGISVLIPLVGYARVIAAVANWFKGEKESDKTDNPLLWDFLDIEDFAHQGGRLRKGDPVERVAKIKLNIPAFADMP